MSVTVAALRLTRRITSALGVDIGTDLAPLIATGRPPAFVTRGVAARRGEFDGISTITIQRNRSSSGNVIVAIPGGAYVVRPTVMHWALYALMARRTGATVVVPVYPLATVGGTGRSVVPKIAGLIADQVTSHPGSRVGVYGDSAGGGLALSAAQYLVANGEPLPAAMVLVSPVLDVTMSNPAIADVDDPVLDAESLHEAVLMWADDLEATDPLVSPLYGSLEGLPATDVYSGSLDVLFPDTLVLQQHALQQGAQMTFDLREGLIHNWAMLPVTSAGRAALPGILSRLVG